MCLTVSLHFLSLVRAMAAFMRLSSETSAALLVSTILSNERAVATFNHEHVARNGLNVYEVEVSTIFWMSSIVRFVSKTWLHGWATWPVDAQLLEEE